MHVVPLGCRREEAPIPRDQALLDRLLVDHKAEAGRLWHRDVAVLNDWFRYTVNKIIPERNITEIVLQRDEIFGSGGAMHCSHQIRTGPYDKRSVISDQRLAMRRSLLRIGWWSRCILKTEVEERRINNEG